MQNIPYHNLKQEKKEKRKQHVDDDLGLENDSSTENNISSVSGTGDRDENYRIATESDNTGLYYLLGAQFGNSVMVISTKLLVTDPVFKDDPIQPFQILFVRMLITLVGTLLYMFYHRKTIPYCPLGPPEVRKFLLARGIFGFFGVFGLYTSLKALSVSDAVVITFLVPTVTAILAAIILKERYSKVEGLCALVALFGVVLVVRPSFMFPLDDNKGVGGEGDSGDDNIVESLSSSARAIASIFGLLGVIGGSIIYIVIKHIGDRAHAIMSVTYFAFITCLISLVAILVTPSITFKIPENSHQWFLFCIIGISGFIMQMLLTIGIQREKKTSRSSLVIYSQIIYSIFWDFVIFHHLPNFWSWCGIIIIIISTLYALFHKNNKVNRKVNTLEDYETDPTSVYTYPDSNTTLSTEFELEEYGKLKVLQCNLGL